ncbi:MAG: hypothetical protein B7Y41_04830 [Hydrogenophilales bacterium 28-61-23]|nr:MAG: hypothetical protein B7Y41_04830 [Hydrogenophilales bacterium 28-61-23]
MVTGMAGMVSTANSNSVRLLLFIACLFSTAAWGGDWRFSRKLALSERYSDNVNLNVKGQEQTDWITEITPSLSVQRAGARLKVNADYSLQGLFYANDNTRNDVRHNLNGRANAEFVENWLYMDASARMSQALTSLNGGNDVEDPVGSGNTTTVGSYTLSPYLKHRFGSSATVEARLSQDGVLISDSSASDTSTNRYQLNAVSGSDFLPLSWSASYLNSNTSNSGAADSGNEKASANARYQVTKNFGLLAQASSEKNDFAGASTQVLDYSSYGFGAFYTPSRKISLDALYNQSDNGSFISGNVRLNPTARTAISFSTTERAYGRSYSLNLAHRTKRSNWNVSYRDDLTTSQQQFLNYIGSGFLYSCTSPPPDDELLFASKPLTDPPNCTFVGARNYFNQTLLNETYLSKSLIGSVRYSLRRNTWQLSLFDTQREFQIRSGGDSTRGLQASWSLRPAVRTTFTLTGGLSQAEVSTGNREDELWNIGLVATRQFQTKVSGSVEARHRERVSNQANSDYSENSLAARLNMAF